MEREHQTHPTSGRQGQSDAFYCPQSHVFRKHLLHLYDIYETDVERIVLNRTRQKERLYQHQVVL